VPEPGRIEADFLEGQNGVSRNVKDPEAYRLAQAMSHLELAIVLERQGGPDAARQAEALFDLFYRH